MARARDVFHDKTIVGSPYKHFFILSAVLFAFWCMLCGNFTAKFVIVGIVSSLVSAYICMPLLLLENRKGDKKYFAFDVNLFKYLGYWMWLLKEVKNANMDVATSVIKSEMDINPKMFKFRMVYDNPIAEATLANSITLTPGTITIDVSDDGVYTIHALTNGAREGLMEGGMQRRIAQLFGETCVYTEEYVE